MVRLPRFLFNGPYHYQQCLIVLTKYYIIMLDESIRNQNLNTKEGVK